jgi:hypothetical protein
MLHLVSCLCAVVLAAPGSSAPQPRPSPSRQTAPALAPSAAPSQEAVDAGEEAPPGAPQDRAAWKEAMDVSNRIFIERTRSNAMQWALKKGGYDARFAAAQASANAADAKRAADAWASLAAARARNYAILTAQWPVDPTRGCRYEVLLLEGAMSDAGKPRQLAAAREDVLECAKKARLALGTMVASNEELERAVADADRAVPPPARPAAAASATPPAPPPAPALAPAAGEPAAEKVRAAKEQ